MRQVTVIAFAVAAFATLHAVGQTTKSPWPKDAEVYFIEPKNGAEVSNPVRVVMGLRGIGVAPAGVEKEKTGHHHILVNADLPKGEAAQYPLPADDNYRHFGGGQTETNLILKPGKHTLQLVVGDHNHVPYDPALASEKITITVK